MVSDRISTFSDFNRLQTFKNAGRCMSELAEGVKVLTDMTGSGKVGTLFGTESTINKMDIQTLAPNSKFESNASTVVNIACIPTDVTKLEDARIYNYEHTSNILLGCIRSSVRESRESEIFGKSRNLIKQSNKVQKQRDFRLNGAMNNGIKNIWTRKRHNRDLHVTTTALLHLNLAPQRVQRYIQRLQERKEKKVADSKKKEAEKVTNTKDPKLKMRQFQKPEDKGSCASNRPKSGPTSSDPISQQEIATLNPLEVNQEEEGKIEEEKKPFNRIIKALTAIVNKDVSAADVKSTAFKGITLTEIQCNITVNTVNQLRPFYSPEHGDNNDDNNNDDDSDDNDDDDDDNEEENLLSVHQCAPLAYLTNAIVKFIVPQQNEWSIAPEVNMGDHILAFLLVIQQTRSLQIKLWSSKNMQNESFVKLFSSIQYEHLPGIKYLLFDENEEESLDDGHGGKTRDVTMQYAQDIGGSSAQMMMSNTNNKESDRMNNDDMKME
ncbi:hypothetical protein BDA99DRAFT_536263 [Phascolomyces articulosus]|uniref:Uncharacterized protein n=1 Tax=Phascolomyces articulosus TaxID=60185 RepID=A0AAD5PH61_9FUNG|nr:hypothetical protein BDA99DRAFT_536263 [Phascolomyces articulosus]